MYENIRQMAGSQPMANLTSASTAMQARVNKLLQLKNHAQSFKNIFTPRWKRNYEYYHNIDRQLLARPEYASKIFVPRPYLVVETKVPRLVQGIAGKDPMFTVLPASSDDVVRSRISQELLTKQWRSQPNGLMELVTWIKDSFIYGLSIANTGWEFKQEPVIRRVAAAPQIDPLTMSLIGSEQIIQTMTTTVDRPYFRNVDIANFLWDPSAATIEDCKYMIKSVKLARHDLKALEALNVYHNIDLIPKNNHPNPVADDFENRQYSLRNAGATNVNSLNFGVDPVYELITLDEYWWIDGDRKMKTIVANNCVIIQDIPIPYWHQRWPFYQLKDNPLTGEFVGLGEIDPIADMVSELNDIRNQQNDNRNQFLKAFWIVNRASNIDLDALENMPPGGALETSGDVNNSIRIERPPQLDGMTAGSQQQINSDIQMTSGANDIAIGTPTRSQIRTATTGSMMAESTNTRFALTAMLALEQLRKVGTDMLALNQQFMSQPLAVRILGADGMTMQNINAIPHDIPNNYDLFVTLGAELQGDQDVMRQQSLQLFQMMAQVPGFRITDYAKEILAKFNEKNPDRFFEGSQVVPTEAILQQLGVDDKSIQSSFVEQSAGMAGGGTQQAAGRPDVLQFAKNNNMLEAS